VDENVIAEQLVISGMGRAEALRKGRSFTQALASLDAQGDSAGGSRRDGNPFLFFVPGRIEVLGKHTDYAGGRSLLAAVERGFAIAARPRSDGRLRITDAASGEVVSFAMEPELIPAAGHWSNYPMTVARRVARNFPGPLCGADVAFLSDLPPAAGMSSSSALITGMFKVLARVNRLAEREEYRANIHCDEALAAYLATIENGQSFASLAGDRGVGTFGGSEDHTAICCCRPGLLHEYVFCPVRFQQSIPLPAGYVFALGASGVLAEKTGEAMAKYNRASRLVSALLELWRTDTGRGDRCLADAVHSVEGAADRLRRIVAKRPHADFERLALLRRLEQFLNENEQIIPAAAQALAEGAMDGFGKLVDQSQHAAEELLENQVPQTVSLARSARQCGAVAASAFGAGFGGSVWTLVEAASAADFLAAWADHYRRDFPAEALRSHFFLSGAGPGLVEIANKTMEMKM
jgi:galactokinase